MGVFYVIPESKKALRSSVEEVFSERGFDKPTEVSFSGGSLVVFNKLDGTGCSFKKDEHHLFVSGTLWHKNVLFPSCGNDLLKSLLDESLDHTELSGTFTLIWKKADSSLSFLHDAFAVNRFFVDNESGIVSSSFLSLASLRNRYKEDFNRQAIAENLLLGFSMGSNTWLNPIQRVRNADQINSSFIEYTRIETDIKDDPKESRKATVERSVKELTKDVNDKIQSFQQSVLLGLSSGFDSRLTASSFSSENIKKLNLYTFHKPGDKDPIIAEDIAKVLVKDLRKIETSQTKDKEALEDIKRRAFNFFDGQYAVMMRYTKEDYTPEFRSKILNQGELHISGVGGEMFRNYNHDHSYTVDMRFWLDQYFSQGLLDTWIQDYDVIQTLITKLKKRLEIEGSRISPFERKRFYSEIFLSDWFGLRNTVENQFGYYYSPFTSQSVISSSYASYRFQSTGGEFEAAMISRLNKDLAALQSEYGHSMLGIPLKIKLGGWLRALSKSSYFARFRNKLVGRKIRKVGAAKDYLLQEVLGENFDIPTLAHLKPEAVETAEYALRKLLKEQ